MSTLDNNTSYNDILLFDDTKKFNYIQFWIFLVLIIPSIFCSIFGLYHFLRDRNLRQALNNHGIILLLIIDLFYQCTNMVVFIHYFRCFPFFEPPPIFRLIWGYFDWLLSVVQFMLYAWVTIERHILVFHDQLVATRNRRLFIHYLPPIILTIYCIIIDIIIYFAIQCENNFDNIGIPSFVPCSYENSVVYMYDLVVHTILPIFIIVLSTIFLLVRVLWQRYHSNQQIQWRRYRKMTIQVLSISSIYLIFPFPYTLATFLHLFNVSNGGFFDFVSRWVYCGYYTLFLFPIVAIGTLPELKNKFKNILPFYRRRRRVTVPIEMNTAFTKNKPPVVQS